MNKKEFIENPELHIQETLICQITGKDSPLVVFDIGACTGENSVRYARIFPSSTIYTFEPIACNFNYIQQYILQYEITSIYPFALCISDTEGIAEFHVSSGKPENLDTDDDWDYGNKSSSLLTPEKTKEVYPWLKFEEIITVQTTTLKQFCKEQSISSIDFIHMDVQGAELIILNGAGDFIHKINMIWLEVENVELYKGQPLKKDIEYFMKKNGFVKIEDTVDAVAGDQFWARKGYIKNKKNRWFLFKRQLIAMINRI
jgi:FkbM family methyltransferase